jgi:GNAT superfamily N-acetyltransferase
MLSIRPAREDDAALIYEMLKASATEQGFPDELAVTEDSVREDGFGPQPRFRVLIAEADSTPAGMALFFINYSTWGSRLGLYLEDLYVRPEYRRSGVALALLRRLAALAREENCGRFQWVVHRENERAIRLYESFGAKTLQEWLLMSIKGADLDRYTPV